MISHQHAAGIQRRLGDRSREGLALAGAARTYRAMHRDGDATDLYRGAIVAYRHSRDHWQLANVLHELAAIRVANGDLAQATDAWRESLAHLEPFTDPRARRLRSDIAPHLG